MVDETAGIQCEEKEIKKPLFPHINIRAIAQGGEPELAES